jgi:hypothetical protein
MSITIMLRFKLWAIQAFPLLRKLGSGHSRFLRISIAELDRHIATVCRVEESKILLTGSHSCGISHTN